MSQRSQISVSGMSDTQTILFGFDPTEGITAVEALESEVVLYVRRGSAVTAVREPFRPWLIAANPEDIPSDWKTVEVSELSGEGYRHLATFPNWKAFLTARETLRGKGADHLAYLNPEKQYLMQSGRTLFKGMTFEEVHRMQFDIETSSLVSDDEGGRILLVAVSDNRGFEAILDGDEAELLRRFVETVLDRDPDVLEGHNVFGFDLPYISARAKKLGVRLTLGRDGSEMTYGSERNCPIGGNSRPFVPTYVHGRHIIDTLFSTQRFDVAKGQLDRYGLKECARVYGLAEPERVYIPGDRIAGLWATDPETIKLYARHDVRETRKLAALVCPAEFYLTQMSPDSYQTVATTGTGEKINAILIREYLRRGHAISWPQSGRAVAGGYTEIRMAGLVRRVVKCDVESLYPSLMLSMGIKPESDVLGVFLPALEELTRRRFEAKSRAKSEALSEDEKHYWDGLQNSFKILINSFYGYLGSPAFNFNDMDAAERITSSGQRLVLQIADSIERLGGHVIEIDTDGVYFQPPESVDSLEAEEALTEEIGRGLPEGIRLAHDGRYAAMLSLKIKNYVLIGYDGDKTFKGASVRSRADEPFGREFISSAVDLLVKGDMQGIGRMYKELTDRIVRRELPVEQFARRERITQRTFSSAQRKRLALVARGLRVGEYITVYEKEDGTLGLIEEYARDEDTEKLLDKLYKFACRLREAFGPEFDTLFPNPSRSARLRKAEAAGQQSLF